MPPDACRGRRRRPADVRGRRADGLLDSPPCRCRVTHVVGVVKQRHRFSFVFNSLESRLRMLSVACDNAPPH